jgi:hypothetical protein
VKNARTAMFRDDAADAFFFSGRIFADETKEESRTL